MAMMKLKLISSRALSRELHQQYDNLPDFLRWNSIGRYMTKDAPDDRLQIDIRLEFIYNDFLLYRNLFKKTKLSPDRIISVSLEIMSAMLSLVARTLETQMSKQMISWNVRHILAIQVRFLTRHTAYITY